MANYIPGGWTDCEIYRGYTIAVKGGEYGAFKGIDGGPQARGSTRAECRRAIDDKILRDTNYHAATGHW